MHREKMDGENLREVEMEVALELWIERYNCYGALYLLDFNGFPPLQGYYIGLGPYRKSAEFTLNLGGTTDA